MSQNIPDTLHKAIELAQRFEDSLPASDKNIRSDKAKNRNLGAPQSTSKEQPKHNSGGNRAINDSRKNHDSSDKPVCNYCERVGHTESVCRKKKAAERVTTPKNA